MLWLPVRNKPWSLISGVKFNAIFIWHLDDDRASDCMMLTCKFGINIINEINFIIYLPTKATLGTEESGHSREVAVMKSNGVI